MADSEYPEVDNVLEFFELQYPYINVQTKDQYEAGIATEPRYLKYNHFSMYYDLAVDEFRADLLSRGGISATYAQTRAALCHLIADYCEMSNPDWSYLRQKVETEPGLPTIDIERGGDTSPRMAYNKLLDIITKAAWRAAPPYNGSSDVEPYFYRGMLEPDSGISTDSLRTHQNLNF